PRAAPRVRRARPPRVQALRAAPREERREPRRRMGPRQGRSAAQGRARRARGPLRVEQPEGAARRRGRDEFRRRLSRLAGCPPANPRPRAPGATLRSMETLVDLIAKTRDGQRLTDEQIER